MFFQLISTKTSDSKSTLLHVIVGNLIKSKPIVLEIHEELSSVPLAAKGEFYKQIFYLRSA